jgi:hypothetical protein
MDGDSCDESRKLVAKRQTRVYQMRPSKAIRGPRERPKRHMQLRRHTKRISAVGSFL